MSLDELLKEPESSSVWSTQRKKLIRIAAGAGVALAGVAIAALVFVSFKHHPPKANEPDSNALAKLMELQKQTKALSDYLSQRKIASTEAPRPVGHGRYGAGHGRVISYDPGEGFVTLTAKNETYIPTGAVFQARLVTPIKTSVRKTFVMAETINDYRMDSKRKIVRGSRLIGRSYFDPVLKGVIVEFTTLVTPNGLETSINGLALSRNALPELEGLYFSDKLTTYGTALAFGFLSGFADAAREREFTLLGSQPQVSLGNQVLTGFSTASFQLAGQMLRDVQQNAVEYVVVPAGEQVFVVLTQKYLMAQGETK